MDSANQGFNNDVYKNMQQNALGINTMSYMNTNDPDRQQKYMQLDQNKNYLNAMDILTNMQTQPIEVQKTAEFKKYKLYAQGIVSNYGQANPHMVKESAQFNTSTGVSANGEINRNAQEDNKALVGYPGNKRPVNPALYVPEPGIPTK